MSRRELERLVDDAESDAAIRNQLQSCRSREELVGTARFLGYLLTERDILRSWWEHQSEQLEHGQQQAERAFSG